MKKPSLSTLHFSAFTLVELIVVIAVLAVLAAISFSTVANITSGARDSARLTDISSMKTSLESYNATKGGYPIPDNAVAISWSGNLAWSQGTFGDNTARTLNTISRPKDPKWSVDYSYSVSNSKKEYEVATVLEKATSYFSTDKAYAQGEQYDTVIKGNYNGVAIKVSSAISAWILAVPTIIASDIKDAKLENVVFAYPKSGNEPFSYTGVVNSPQAVPTGWIAKQVWSGALVLPKTDSELQQLTADLKTAYTGSPAASGETIKSLLATSDEKTYGSNIVNTIGGTTNTPLLVITNDGSSATKAGTSCNMLHNAGINIDGVYWIKPSAAAAFRVYCDMTTNGGGWTRIFYQTYATSIDTTSTNLLASTRPYAFTYNSYEEIPASNIAFSDVLINTKTATQMLYKISNVPQSVKDVFSLGILPRNLSFMPYSNFTADATNLLTSTNYPAASIDFYSCGALIGDWTAPFFSGAEWWITNDTTDINFHFMSNGVAATTSGMYSSILVR